MNQMNETINPTSKEPPEGRGVASAVGVASEGRTRHGRDQGKGERRGPEGPSAGVATGGGVSLYGQGQWDSAKAQV